MKHYDGLLFDCDNHYYEAEDAFMRHVPRRMQRRCVQWVEMGKKRHHLVAGKLNHAVGNPTFDPISSLLVPLRVEAKGTATVRFLVGCAKNRADATKLIARYLKLETVEAERDAAQDAGLAGETKRVLQPQRGVDRQDGGTDSGACRRDSEGRCGRRFANAAASDA